MDDLYFENKLKNIQIEKIKEELNNFKPYFEQEHKRSNITHQVFQELEDILYEYYVSIYEDQKDYNEISSMIDKFKEQFMEDSLSKMYENSTFTKEESEYIALTELSSIWREKNVMIDGGKYAVIDVFLRRKIIEEFDSKLFLEIIENKIPKTRFFEETIRHYTQLLSDKPFGDKIHERFDKKINERAEHYFNQSINCGGYALKIDECVFPTNNNNFSQAISSILNQFPFIRLLGDRPLEDDEYMVLYRAPSGKNIGHHFIRVDSDGTVREKDANNKPEIFRDWGNLEDASEAIFAVKKEHKMFGYKSIDFKEKGLDFEESVRQAIKEKRNSFSYHNHEFSLKKSKQDEIFITTVNGDIVGQAIVEEDDCLVEVFEEKSEYVENTSCGITPIIENGKLINLKQFKARAKEGKDILSR